MAGIECIITHGFVERDSAEHEKLKADVSKYTGRGFTEAQAQKQVQYDFARDIHQQIHTELNNLRKEAKVAAKDYVPPKDNTAKIPDIEKDFENKKNELRLKREADAANQKANQPDQQSNEQAPPPGPDKAATTEAIPEATGAAEPPPLVPELGGQGTDNNGVKISKAAFKAEYGFSQSFDERGGGTIAKEVQTTLQKRADENGISPERQAANEVMEMKDNPSGATEHDIVTAGWHLLNIDTALRDAIAKNDLLSIESLTKSRDLALSVLRQLGNSAGRNLGLFNLIFKEASDGEISVARDNIKRVLGLDEFPATLEELKSSTLTAEDKAKVKPYIEEIERLQKERDVYESNAANNIQSINDDKVQQAIKEAREAGRKEGMSLKGDKAVKAKRSQSLKDMASNIRRSDEMDKFLKGSSGFTDTKSSIIDLGSYKEIIANLLDGVAAVVEAGENVAKYLSDAVGKIKGVDSQKLLSDVQILMARTALPSKEETVSKIKSFAENEKTSLITASMVDGGLIKHFVDDHIFSEVPSENVIETATEELKQYLPDITKEDVADAYVRRNQFKQETKQQLENAAVEKKQEVRRLVVKEGRLKALEAADNYHAAENKEDKQKLKSEYEKGLDDRIADLRKQQDLQKRIEDVKSGKVADKKTPKEQSEEVQRLQAELADLRKQQNIEKSVKEIQKEIDFVREEGKVFKKAIKSRKDTSELLKAARKARDQVYMENGLQLENGDRQPIKIEQDYQEALKKIEDNPQLSDEEKQNQKDDAKQLRDEDLKGTKQGVISSLSDDIGSLIEDNTKKANDASDVNDTEKSKHFNDFNEKLREIKDGIQPTGEKLDTITNKAYGKLNELIKDKNITKEEKEHLEKIKKDFENNNQLTANELAAAKLKKQWESEIKASNTKINSGSFSVLPKDPFDFKVSVELSNLNRERNTTNAKLRALVRDAQEKTRGFGEKALDLSTKMLVSGIGTIEKVAEASVVKPFIDTLVENTSARLTSGLSGAPRATMRAIVKGFKTIGAFKNREAAEAHLTKLLNERNAAWGVLKAAKDTGDAREIKKADDKFKKADLEYAITTLYKSINPNAADTFWEIAKHGATDYDEASGYGLKKYIDDKTTILGKAGYIADGWIRLHGAFKTSLPARIESMRSFAATLTDFQEKGIPLDEEHIALAQLIAANSYDYGRLTNKTSLSRVATKAKYSEKSQTSRVVTKVFFPITTIALNLAKRGIDYSSAGAEGWIKLASKTKQAMKLNEAEGKVYDTWAEKYRDAVNKIPLQDRIYINGVISRGLFGLATTLLTAWGLSTGNIKYGGSYSDSKKRKVLDSNGHVLEHGEWEMFGWRPPKIINVLINHTPEFLNVALTSNIFEITKKGKPNELRDIGSTITSELGERFPFQTLLGLFGYDPVGTLIDRFTRVPLAKDIGGAFDPNSDKRKNKTAVEKLRTNTGFGAFNAIDPKKK